MSDKIEKIRQTPQQWRQKLDTEIFRICREGGTEQAFSGKYWDCKTSGTYCCAACRLPLFDSETKYDSGSGWPSFYQALEDEVIMEREDRSLGMLRVEVLCQRCESHLGHVFPDGPEPSGLRYCINSAALQLIASPSH